MKIILVHPSDPSSPSIGGDARQTLNFLEYFTKKGVTTTFFGVKIQNNNGSSNDFDFIPILNTGTFFGFRFALGMMLRIPFLKLPSSATILSYRLMYLLPFILLCPKNPKVLRTGSMPLFWVKLHYPQFLKPFSFFYKRFESVLIRKVDLLMPVDESTKQYYVSQYPNITKNVIVIPVGIDLSKFKPMDKKTTRKKYGFDPEDKIILFAGRVERIKGLDFLIKSFKSVKEMEPNAKLVIVGRGSDETRLRRLTEEFELTDVVFMGFQNPRKIPEILNCADVVVLCSVSEASPNIVREAFACGVPVVSTNVGDVQKIITNEWIGRIVERNEESFAIAITDILNLEPEKVKKECIKISKNFDLNQVNRRIMMMCQKMEAAKQNQLPKES
ncbi:glycosyltransferase family 4 protein [Candidatus Bathyarchaeota archaeon]|nr:glycosyltransferase family 4 protein [Candidatus Bathyarchaeota archaeon]